MVWTRGKIRESPYSHLSYEERRVLTQEQKIEISHKSVAKRHGFSTYEEYLKNIHNKDMRKNKKCGLYLGCHIAERILSNIFKRVERLPYNHPGYDFVCDKGHKIDVKASCIQKGNTFKFTISNNKTPDYFLLIAFDNRQKLNPLGIWLIKSDEIIRGRKLNAFKGLGITNTPKKLAEFNKYEQTDKLAEVLNCCDNIKNGTSCKTNTH